MWRKEEVVKKIRAGQAGRSLRTYATALGCSAPYLSDVYLGKRDPGPKLLNHLNLERQETKTVVYVEKRRWR